MSTKLLFVLLALLVELQNVEPTSAMDHKVSLVLPMLFGFFMPETESARVLMVAPIAGKSMKSLFYGLGSGLASKGHEVVFVNAYKPTSPVQGIHEIVPAAFADFYSDDKFPNIFQIYERGMLSVLEQYTSFFIAGPRALLKSKELDQLLQEKFDLVVLGPFAYSLYFLPFVFKVPFIFVTPFSYFPILTSPLGNPTIPAVVPTVFVSSSEDMTFITRVKNMLSHLFMEILLRRIYSSYTDEMVAEKFGDGAIPPALEIERNASLVLLSSSPVINYHKPLLPNTIEVAGLHCRDPQPMPKELVEFLGDSEFIYFSLGSVVKPRDIPPEQKSAILAALGSIPLKVLLKWDTTNRTDIPDNIFPSKWLPQQDILGNSKCRLFVSHAGFASFIESVCHGVPMLALPLFADQQYNTINAVNMGMAEMLTWDQLTLQTLESAIRAVLSPGYRAAARHRQQLLRELPMPPRDLAVHWAEHIIRHGGAPHLRSVGADLNVFQYYSLDVLTFLLAIMLVVLLMMLKLFVVMINCCCRLVPGFKVAPAPTGSKKEN